MSHTVRFHRGTHDSRNLTVPPESGTFRLDATDKERRMGKLDLQTKLSPRSLIDPTEARG